jgi:hypothetical protein
VKGVHGTQKVRIKFGALEHTAWAEPIAWEHASGNNEVGAVVAPRIYADVVLVVFAQVSRIQSRRSRNVARALISVIEEEGGRRAVDGVGVALEKLAPSGRLT